MNEIDHQPATDDTVVRLVREARANDATSAPTRHSNQTDRCPPVARFSAVLRCGGTWTPDEQSHVAACRFCKRVYDMFVTAIPALEDAPTVTGGEVTVSGARVASAEDTVVDGSPRTPSQPSAGAEDTITDRPGK